MTVTYNASVATSSFSCFLKLLARWQGSIYKLLWKDFALFAAIYYLLGFLYRFILTTDQKRVFEMISRYCERNNSLIPLAFVLGFFIDLVVTRWWNQVTKIPWPDRMAMFVSGAVQGQDDRGRLMRRTIMRYLCLSYVITMSSISPVVRKRFPSFKHMADAGFMNPNELEVIENIKTPHNKYFVPLAWATSLVKRARLEQRIKDDFAVKTLNDEINEYRGCLGTLFLYDWINIPMVYTQVVTLACYMFFLSCLMGRQFLDSDPDMPNMYFPIFTFLQYFFYMGWLKVAESLINPFGEDDEDFDINSLIDRNLQVSYLIVDEMHNEHPQLIKDQYWDEVEFNLPYTVASEPFRIPVPHLGSAINLNLSAKEKETIFPLNAIDEEFISGSPADCDSETNSVTKPDSRLFRLNSLTSSIKSGRAGFLPSRRKKRSSKRKDTTPTHALQHHPSVHSSISSYISTIRGRTSPTSHKEDIFQMSDVENEPEDTGPPPMEPSSSRHPAAAPEESPRTVYAKSIPVKSGRPRTQTEYAGSLAKSTAPPFMDEVTEIQQHPLDDLDDNIAKQLEGEKSYSRSHDKKMRSCLWGAGSHEPTNEDQFEDHPPIGHGRELSTIEEGRSLISHKTNDQNV